MKPWIAPGGCSVVFLRMTRLQRSVSSDPGSGQGSPRREGV
jgi:hypothetical protein